MYLYSNPTGTFLIDKGKIVKKKEFSNPKEAHLKLAQGEWLAEEESLAKEADVFLGYKTEKKIKTTTDQTKLAEASKLTNATRDIYFSIAEDAVKNSVSKDELVIQAARALQDVEKTINLLGKRLREWYGLEDPETATETQDITLFVNSIGKGKSSMGTLFSAEDKTVVENFVSAIKNLIEVKKQQDEYVQRIMKDICPNISAVVGASVGAKMLSEAGSLQKLATMPASTVQLLGAEKAMFAYLRKKQKKMPRFGILHEHSLIAQAKEKDKGKVARLLADKLTIAARVDYFKGAFVGDKLWNDVQKHL